MASFNQIVEQITSAIGKQFDQPTIERVKSLLILGYSKYVKQEISKYGIQDNYISQYKIELEKVPVFEDCDGTASDCFVLQSVNKIVQPIPYRGSEPFISVVTLDGVKVAMKASDTVSKHQKFARFGHGNIMYEIYDGKLRIYNNLKLGVLKLKGIYPKLNLSLDCNNNCYDRDYEFPISGDYIAAIKVDIFKELGLLITKPEDVPVTEEVNNVKTKQ